MKANTLSDAFGRIRVGSPSNVFNSKLTVDNQPLFWDDAQVSGSLTDSVYQTNASSVLLSVGAAAGKRVRQTKRRFNYQPGKSQLIFITGEFGAAALGVTKRVGYFDDNNGIFFQQTATGYSIGKRSNVTGTPVDTMVSMEDWNMGGTVGGVWDFAQFDLTKSLIFYINFEWLGVGSIEWGLVIDGRFYVLHQMNHATVQSGVYMTIPNLPIRYEIEGTGTASNMRCICSTVISEGGSDIVGAAFAYANTTGITTLNDANRYGIFCFRLKSTHLHATVDFNELNVVCTSVANYCIRTVLNPTVTGTALVWTDIANSALQVAQPTNATTFSAGTLVDASVGSTTIQSAQTEKDTASGKVGIGSTIAGVADILAVTAERITGTTETFYGSINWIEIY
jgi:hypothetical protein